MSRGASGEHRKLMEWLAPDPKLGALQGFLATTYELSRDFVDTDFLPALLDLGPGDVRGWKSTIALERGLGALEASAILMDQRCYAGRPRSLRLEVRPAVGRMGQLLHAKVLLAVHERAVRLQLASANLTETGYRHNREVALPVTATPERAEAAALALQGIAGMPSLLEAWWCPSAARVHAMASERLKAWAGGMRAQDRVVWGGGDTPLWKQVLEAWPAGDRVERIAVVSPFWSEEGASGPFSTLLGALRGAGALEGSVDVDLYVDADLMSRDQHVPRRPTLGAIDPDALGMTLTLRAVDPQPRDQTYGASVLKTRMLHAKVLLLQGRRHTLAYVGSANFTERGWGFLGAPRRANVEAGVVMVRTGPELLRRLVPPTTGKPVRITGAAARFPTLESELEPCVPTFLRAAWLEVVPRKEDQFRLRVEVEPSRVQGAFFVLTQNDARRELGSGNVGVGAEMRVDLNREDAIAILRDPQVMVKWWESPEPACYPVNITPDARDLLPDVPGSGRPGEEYLLAYYMGRMSYETLFAPPEAWEEAGELEKPGAERSEVDTSKIQSYRIREFVESLPGIRRELEEAAHGTPGRMRRALLGAVSPVALARAVREAVQSGERSPVAAGFQLVELQSLVRSLSSLPKVVPEWAETVDEASRSIAKVLGSLMGMHRQELDRAGGFHAYARSVLGRRPARGTR